MADNTADELITAGEARRLLGISTRKLAELFRDGALTAEPDPLDKRLKLVHRDQVEALLARSKREKAA
jgi:hypothetical protein